MADDQPTESLLRLHVKSMAGDVIEVEISADSRVAELKRRVQAQRPEFAAHLQRLVFMPADGGDCSGADGSDAFVVLKNCRTLASYGLAVVESNSNLNLVMVDAHVQVSNPVSVYLSAVLEYLVAEVLELSGNAARTHPAKKNIAARHIATAIREDEELRKVRVPRFC